jgi:Ca2+-binding EF-hand superfamily protein
MGMDVGVDEAKQIVKFYDVEGDGEMRYQDLVKDVVEGVPHFMTHPNLTGRDTRRDERVELGSASTKEAPEAVKRIEAKIRDAAEVAATKSVTRIGGQDLFYGTCIRFDAGNTGSLSRADLDRALREIRCKLGEVETRHLVGWYDQGARDSVMYKNLVRSVWSVTRGGGTTARGGGDGREEDELQVRCFDGPGPPGRGPRREGQDRAEDQGHRAQGEDAQDQARHHPAKRQALSGLGRGEERGGGGVYLVAVCRVFMYIMTKLAP